MHAKSDDGAKILVVNKIHVGVFVNDLIKFDDLQCILIVVPLNCI